MKDLTFILAIAFLVFVFLLFKVYVWIFTGWVEEDKP